MVSVYTAICYAALGYCAWKLIDFATNATCKLPHRLPPVPKGVHPPPSHVDVLRPFFVTSKGLALYVRKWLPRFDCPPRGVFFILHGLGEHGGRYDRVGRTLAKNGFAVFMVDHQGHGMSDGERMYADKVQDLSEDYIEFVQHVLNGPKRGDRNVAVVDPELEAHADVNWKDLPRFALGHSMGGLLLLLLVELSIKQGLSWNGVVLSSPALWVVPGGGVPCWAPVLAKMVPRLRLEGLDFTKLGNDVDVYKRWSRDPLVPKYGATLGLAYSLVKEAARLSQSDNELVKRFPAPLYILHGGQDMLTFPQGSVNFYSACTQKDKTLNIVPNAAHEVLNVEGSESFLFLITIIEWAVARL